MNHASLDSVPTVALKQPFSSPLMPVISTSSSYSTFTKHSSTIPSFSPASKPSLTSPARHSPHSDHTSMTDISLSAIITANPPVPTYLKAFPEVQFSAPSSSSPWSNNLSSWTPLSLTSHPLWVTEIKSWLQINLLKLNRDKSLTKPSHNSLLSLDCSTVSPLPSARNLGVIFDQALSFNQTHHQKKKAFFHLGNITAPVLPSPFFFGADSTSVLQGSPSNALKKLQYVQKSLLHVFFTQSRSCDLTTSVLHKLH